MRFQIQVGATKSVIDSLGAFRLEACIDMAATYNGSLMRIYLDGILDNALAPGLTGGSSFDLTDLGGNQVDRDRPFNGVVDELAVTGKAVGSSRSAQPPSPTP